MAPSNAFREPRRPLQNHRVENDDIWEGVAVGNEGGGKHVSDDGETKEAENALSVYP